MASSSSSSSPSHPYSSLSLMNPRNNKYDVFLSFSRADTRDSFTSHLHSALCQKSIEIFIDDQLIRGDDISESLLDTIASSSISIIIFSERYASSGWCLGELLKILECKHNYGQIVIPVFYRVDPLHVRKQVGIFGDSFLELEERFPEKMQRWRSALTEAANLSGFDSHVFSRHAFKENLPNELGYQELSEKIINYAQGVPLALEILGCFLYGKGKEVWENAINELKRILNMEIQKGTEKIEGIYLDMSKVRHICLNSNTFTKMRKLRFLKFYSSISKGENKCKVSNFQGSIFAEVRYLHWHGYPLTSLPSNINPDKLLFLEIPHSNIEQLWDCVQHHGKFNRMVIAASNSFTKTPNPSLIPRLNKLVSLNLIGCSKLKRLPVEISSVVNVEEVRLNGTAIEKLPSSIGSLSGLLDLDLQNCKRLKSLPSSLLGARVISRWVYHCRSQYL
ncbi:hypothetical protein WN943_015437 [Citrus x changshan-huyou]